MLKNQILFINDISFFPLNARLVIIQLRKIFCKALIFYYFYPKYDIQIKTKKFGYAIYGYNIKSLISHKT